MRSEPTHLLPPLLYPSLNSSERKKLTLLRKKGQIRLIGPRLYASVPLKQVATVVRANWAQILSALFPNSFLSHRTAFEYKPSPEGEVILTGTTNREINYPGLRLRFIRGPEPLEDDPKFLTLRASSQARMLLENLSTIRKGAKPKTASRAQIEMRLEQLVRDGGEDAINALRDRARTISKQFEWKMEFERLDGLIGAILGTRSCRTITTALARARAIGQPYDPACLERMQLLFGELRNRALPAIPDRFVASGHFKNKSFFESYFSNFIEGTTFELEEAEDIVFNKKIPRNRPKDAHDIVGTFQIISDPNEMRRTPQGFDQLQNLLISRHHTLMKYRREASPGEFKKNVNRAGDTVFVHPDLVVGTLKKGLELYDDLTPGLPRAIFMMFLISDIHPFVDGNGRIARIMMNAELVSSGFSTILVPNVYREDYLLALRSLTRRHRPRVLVDMLLRAQRFSNLEFSPYAKILKELQRRNWFREPEDARRGIRLLPDAHCVTKTP
ncbi:Fic family protein [Bdellovibrionota bacterium FG-1]